MIYSHTRREQTVTDMHPSEQRIITSSRGVCFGPIRRVRGEGVRALSWRESQQAKSMTQAAAPVLINPLKIIYYSFVL